MPGTFNSMTSIFCTLLAMLGVLTSMARALVLSVRAALRRREVQIRGLLAIVAVTGALCLLSDGFWVSEVRELYPDDAAREAGPLGYFPYRTDGGGLCLMKDGRVCPSLPAIHERVARLRIELALMLAALSACVALWLVDRIRRARLPDTRPLVERFGFPLAAAAGMACTIIFWRGLF